MIQPGERHFTVSVYIFSTESEPRVLLLFHKKLQKWMQPGGHIEPFENPLEAAAREVLEETGIDVEPNLLPAREVSAGVLELQAPASLQQHQIDTHGNDPMHYHLDLGYIVKVPHRIPSPANDESMMVNWFTLEQLDKLDMFDNVRELVKELMQKVINERGPNSS